MKGITRLNSATSNGKIGVGGAFFTFVLTIVIIILETRKTNQNKISEIGEEYFFSCVENGRRESGVGIQSFLHCTVTNIMSDHMSHDIKIGAVQQSTNDIGEKRKKSLRSSSIKPVDEVVRQEKKRRYNGRKYYFSYCYCAC